MARRVFAPRPGKKIDFKQWSATPALVSTVSTDGTALGGGLDFVVPATILRIRGFVQAIFDATMQAGDLMILTYGIAIISTDAFNAGSGSVPDPSGDPEYPWMWWGQMRLQAFVAAGHEGGWGPTGQRLEVDTKAMRKIKPSETLTTVFQRTGTAGAPATDVTIGQMRTLIGT